ncbi:MAG: hypothetical protein HY289_04160 [Planctomycetes bacterium]|nr:hypothetical protein [Planctomycetota bacterium]
MKLFLNLGSLAHGRSGDKGNHANIAVIAYTQAGYDWLRGYLTAERVAQYFAPMFVGHVSNVPSPQTGTLETCPTKVVRYEAPNVWGLNFLLYDILAGGASRSLRIDTQGKTLALTLLRMDIDAPPNFADMLRDKEKPS